MAVGAAEGQVGSEQMLFSDLQSEQLVSYAPFHSNAASTRFHDCKSRCTENNGRMNAIVLLADYSYWSLVYGRSKQINCPEFLIEQVVSCAPFHLDVADMTAHLRTTHYRSNRRNSSEDSSISEKVVYSYWQCLDLGEENSRIVLDQRMTDLNSSMCSHFGPIVQLDYTNAAVDAVPNSENVGMTKIHADAAQHG